MRNSKGHSLIELCVAVVLLIILGFLTANIYVIQVAKMYNDRVCRDSIMLAAKEALEGKSEKEVIAAAYDGMRNCGRGGFFIGHPQFSKYSDQITSDVRVLTIQTYLRVRVPVPLLVMSDKLKNNSLLTLKSTYEYRIKNPKEIGSGESSTSN